MHIGDFSIRTRLLSGFGLIAALMLAAAAAGSWGLHSIVETTRKAIEGDFRVARLAAEIKMGVGQLRRFEKDVFINIESPEKVASYSQKWQLAMEQTEHARSTAYKLAQDDARGAVDALGGELRAYAEGFRTTLTLISGGTVTTTAQANDVMGKYKTAVYRTEELVDQVHKGANHRAGKVDEVIRERRDSVRVILITLAALSLLIAVSLAIVITRGIAQPLQYAVRIAQRVAAGELGHHIAARGDEIGQLLQALREMDCQLAETIGEVREGAQTVRATASELAHSNDHMSQRTQEQASSLEETAASIEEMTASVQANAENAGHANRLARGAREVATAGGETVTKAAEAMEAISNSSRRIADIISVIDEIAFQTNLLALNAAVEAARAGEQGRGFAVVAGEVRNLAQRSAAAAKEIKALIGDSVEKVHAGSKLVEKSGEHLRMIVESIHKVTDVVAEIASASSQQAAGVTQLNDAVSQLDAMTQQNAAATEQISAASKQMFEQSERLAKKTAYFRVRSPGETQASALSPGRATAAVSGAHPTRADSDPDLELRYVA